MIQVGVIYYLPHHEVLIPNRQINNKIKNHLRCFCRPQKNGKFERFSVLYHGPITFNDLAGALFRFKMMECNWNYFYQSEITFDSSG
uniref:Uncharacterized protein n=1 Tax=Brugia malayi TaxID=6279 RepID=A8Q0R1_BRUMA